MPEQRNAERNELIESVSLTDMAEHELAQTWPTATDRSRDDGRVIGSPSWDLCPYRDVWRRQTVGLWSD